MAGWPGGGEDGLLGRMQGSGLGDAVGYGAMQDEGCGWLGWGKRWVRCRERSSGALAVCVWREGRPTR